MYDEAKSVMNLAHITPTMLTWAIQQQTASNGYVVWALSVLMGVPIETINQWQQDQAPLTMDQARRLADLLNVPLGYFWLSEPPESFDRHWREWKEVRRKSPIVFARRLENGNWVIRFGEEHEGEEEVWENAPFQRVYEFVEESND